MNDRIAGEPRATVLIVTCWPDQRADQIRLRITESAGYANMWRDPALTWRTLLALVAAIERVLPSQTPDDSREQLRANGIRATLAWELRHHAKRLTEPTPASIREFIDRNPRPAG